jgi:hypothetical protein
VEPGDDDPDEGVGSDPESRKSGLIAKRGDATFVIDEPWYNVRYLSVVHEGDLDGDGLVDALIENASHSSYVMPEYLFVAGTRGGRFVAQEFDSGRGLTVETWRGRLTAVVRSDNEGYNFARPESVTRRFAFEDGHPVQVDEQREVEIAALANLRAEDFEADPNHERVLWFDLDGDGKKDALAGTLWARWGRIQWEVRFADGRVSPGEGNSACKRLGVLAEKTLGHRDLVCDFDARIRWDGQRYSPRASKSN